MRTVCTILYRRCVIDTMNNEETLSEYCQRKLSEKYVIVPYGEHNCAIYNRESRQYLTMYSHKLDAERDLEFLLTKK